MQLEGLFDGGCLFAIVVNFEVSAASRLDSVNYRREKSVKNNQDQTVKLIKIKERDLKNQFNRAAYLLFPRFSLFCAFLCPTQMQSLKLEPFSSVIFTG